MPATDDLTAIRRLLDVPPPTDDVTAAGRARLDDLVRREVGHTRPRPPRVDVGSARRGRRLGVVTATVAAAAAIATTLTLVHRPSAPPGAAPASVGHPAGAAAPAPSPAPGAVKQAILTAVRAAGGDLLHLAVTNTGGPAITRGVVQYWWWPARPTPGQQVRLLIDGNGISEAITFTEPATAPGRSGLEMIPASGAFTDQASKTWQPVTQFAYGGIVAGTITTLLDASWLRSTYLLNGDIGKSRTAVDGRSAIEIDVPAIPTLRVQLWVDAHTYLPLRMKKLDSGSTNNPVTTKVYDYQFLPATSDNLSRLTLTVPTGYAKAAN